MAHFSRTVIPYRDAKLLVRSDGEERTHAGSLGLVDLDRIAAAADFVMQRLTAVEKVIMRGLRVSSLAPRVTTSTTAMKREPQKALVN